ncbi:hypothetical protein D3C84_818760 [compost metagenome]
MFRRAVPGRRTRVFHQRQHRHQPLSQGWLRRCHTDQERRRRDVPLQGQGPQPCRKLHPRPHRPGQRTRGAGTRTAPRHRTQRVAPVLPTENQPRRLQPGRRRSPDPLAPSDLWRRAAGTLHPAGRRKRHDPANRRLGPGNRLPADGRMAPAVRKSRPAVGQPGRRPTAPTQPAGPHRTVAQGQRSQPRFPATGNHRKLHHEPGRRSAGGIASTQTTGRATGHR